MTGIAGFDWAYGPFLPIGPTLTENNSWYDGETGNLADNEGYGVVVTFKADKNHGWTGSSDTASTPDFVTVQSNGVAETRSFNGTIRIWKRIA